MAISFQKIDLKIASFVSKMLILEQKPHFRSQITILSQKELENEIMNTVGQYPELMSAMKSYNENHDFEKVS